MLTLHKRVVNEYKEGKAFRAFDFGFLKLVSYHKISLELEYLPDILLPQGHLHKFSPFKFTEFAYVKRVI